MESQIEVFEEPRRGDLAVLPFDNLNFDPQRLFWIANVPPGEVRARHWHKQEKQYLFAIRGEFSVSIESKQGISRRSIATGLGVDLPRQAWIEIYDFTLGAVAGVLSSRTYDPSDCYSDYEEFCREVLQRA